jgi:hypothetical protein
LLSEGMGMAEASQDLSQVAFCWRAKARLAKAKGMTVEAHEWATEAVERFRQLDMLVEVEETRRFISGLGAEFPEEND